MSIKFNGRIGVICDTTYTRHPGIINYYYAVSNLFPSTKLISSHEELDSVDYVFVGNDHFQPNLAVWSNREFINKCNNKQIPFFVYTAETIQSTKHHWNPGIQRALEEYQFLRQRMYDVNDAIAYKKKIARCAMSRNFYNTIPIPQEKINKCAFLGAVYPERYNLLSRLEKIIDLEIVMDNPGQFRPADGPARTATWQSYMETMAKYRFVLSPHSLEGHSFPLKFYEILLVNSIPVHQVYSNTLDYYTEEAKFKDAIFFQNAEELPEKLAQCTLKESYSKPWLEDILTEFFIENGVEYTEI